jgi:hypothetical protein
MKLLADITVLAIGCVVIGAATKGAIFLFSFGYNLF